MIAKKVCTQCGKNKPLALFGRHVRNSDGREALCRMCKSDRNRRYRNSNPRSVYLDK